MTLGILVTALPIKAQESLAHPEIFEPEIHEEVWTNGVVRKLNYVRGKITIKQEAIAPLDMPAMTMTYTIDFQQFPDLEVDQKIKFVAAREQGRYVVKNMIRLMDEFNGP